MFNHLANLDSLLAPIIWFFIIGGIFHGICVIIAGDDEEPNKGGASRGKKGGEKQNEHRKGSGSNH